MGQTAARDLGAIAIDERGANRWLTHANMVKAWWTADHDAWDVAADGPCPAIGIKAASAGKRKSRLIAGQAMSMWRHEGEQFGSGFNLTNQS
jgi:hypothetical protein